MKPATKLQLGFTRKEVIGVFTLLTLILLLYAGAHLIRYIIKQPPITHENDTAWLRAAAILRTKTQTGDTVKDYANNNFFNQTTANSYFTPTARTLFYFNPNEASAEDWQQLGLKPKTIRTILNYRNKGGQFRKPEDLQKIYGLSQADYTALLPYVRMPNVLNNSPYPATNNIQTSIENPSHPTYTKKTYQVIDINGADTTAYIALPGVGSALAKRILNFREKLGGFYRIEQVGETYGVADSTFQKIKPYLQVTTNTVRKLNLNTSPVEVLAAHPYIKWPIAKSIVAFRQQHGIFKQVSELQNVMSIDNVLYEKIRPYVTID
jgi:competence protein ComEA